MFIMPTLADIVDYFAGIADGIATFLRDNRYPIVMALGFLAVIQVTTTIGGLMFDHAKTLGHSRYVHNTVIVPVEA